jgi:uncharacterized protein YwgA
MSHINALKAAGIVRDAGGRVVGRTRLQKVAYLLSVVGLEDGFLFSYKHYGPYSEDLATAAHDANLLGLLIESEQQASWGGTYSIYTVDERPSSSSARRRLAEEAAKADAIELELAATAVLLAKEGHSDPWIETARRKPEKAENGRIDRARVLYRQLSTIETPIALPAIV